MTTQELPPRKSRRPEKLEATPGERETERDSNQSSDWRVLALVDGRQRNPLVAFQGANLFAFHHSKVLFFIITTAAEETLLPFGIECQIHSGLFSPY